jgi:hypothetical protein
MAQTVQPTILTQTLSHESLASTATDGDQPWSNRSDSLAGPDPASPPTSVEAESVVGVAPPTKTPRPPRGQAQPRRPRPRRAHGAGQGIELDTFSRSEPEDERRSSHSSTKTSDSWLTLITGSISETLQRPSSNWALFAFLIHYFLLLAFGVTQIFLQFWTWKTSGAPNSVQETAAKMQQLFGDLAHQDAKHAHEDATKLLAAITSKTAEEAKWEPIFNRFIEIAKACVGVAVSRCCRDWVPDGIR